MKRFTDEKIDEVVINNSIKYRNSCVCKVWDRNSKYSFIINQIGLRNVRVANKQV